ncbi:MAG: hypothetical protein M1157_01975 [Deinococcus sp.]|nr:hypothetical protein [Deinococcus sp.]
MNSQEKTIIAGFALVAAVLALGIWKIDATLSAKAERLNVTLARLPDRLLELLRGTI